MRGKKACLVVDLRDGVNIPKITDMIAVLAAAGWKVDPSLKVYGGESLQLAYKASKQGYEVIIAYGGDGTLNQVVNGVMNAKRHNTVAILPGGTVNDWATESGVPLEPFHASLALVNSQPRQVDLGYLDVKGLLSPEPAQGSSSGKPQKQQKKGADTKHRFLLLAGIGFDAAATAHISKTLKYRVGQLAYGLAAVKELPQLHAFPVELRSVSQTGEETLLWQGEAWQVFFCNTRISAGPVELAPQAYIDDGQLDVCLVKAGNVLSTIEEVASLLFKHQAAGAETEYFRGPRFSLRVPASIRTHIDGCVVALKDYLGQADAVRLKQADDPSKVMVEYTFSAEPAALHMTVPRTYTGTLFQKTPAAALSQPATDQAQQHISDGSMTARRETPEQLNTLVSEGTKVTVVGVGPVPEKQETYIIAGTTHNEDTGDTKPVAVGVNDKTALLSRNGEYVSLPSVQTLQEGAEIVVEGKENKRGAIRATQVVV
jgi:YegS/Rv2252/BmrU family lipid kinase